MRTIFHPDYWVRIPEGEFLFGLLEEHRKMLREQLKELVNYSQRPRHEQNLIDSAIGKLATVEALRDEEIAVFGFEYPDQIHYWRFNGVYEQKRIWLKEFYIARYPITNNQYKLFRIKGQNPSELPGTLEEPETINPEKYKNYAYTRCAAEVQTEKALRFCEQLGARLPTVYEWEKAARGTDGRLYPWGNVWNPNAGFFSYRQYTPKMCSDGNPPVDAYPAGVSPYGVWAMVGGLPELVTVPTELQTIAYEYGGKHHEIKASRRGYQFNGNLVYRGLKGRHPKEVDPQWAPFQHIIPLQGVGGWVGLRPVLDKWPKQSWSGYDIPK